ncbi:AfsR/SARP family transcriptional regulator [Micromonospora echinofusca]|uniref:AfsR/SARP family transcriptional regulator n=1 Tax=Micromonospora echinofusca TaxID=47858 RepID=UPI0033164E60
MEFYFLGPLTIRSGATSVYLSGERSQKLFAALLLNSNQPVSVERLIDVVWDHRPPGTARQQIQNRLGRLRALLLTGGQRITRTGNSYALEVSEKQIDGLRFRQLCTQAEQARCAGQLDRAASLLHAGLTLWRGSTIQGIDSPALRGDIVRWEEARLRAIEAVVAVEFSRQRHSAMTTDLYSWVQHYPYHEGLHCSLAEALHAGSRTAEAVHVLHQLKLRLARELGINAGTGVHGLHRRLLGADVAEADDSAQLKRQAAEAIHRALTETTQALKVLSNAIASY